MIPIERICLTRVRVPLRPAYVSSRGIRREYLKAVVQIVGSDGVTGIGETSGSPGVYRKACDVALTLLGCDCLDRSMLRRPPQVSGAGDRRSMEEWIAIGGLEMALWDLAGKHLSVPAGYLLGGRYRETVDMVCELSAAPFDPDRRDEDAFAFFEDFDNIEKVVVSAEEQVRSSGYRIVKVKSVGLSPEWDFRLMSAVREALGRDVELRFDPNGAYTPAQAISLCRKLDPLGLQWFEDPTAGLEGMRRVQSRVKTKLGTNMWVTQFDDLPSAIRLGGTDVVGVDAFHWGGLANATDLIAICRFFGLETFFHCFFDLGITTAANLQLAAAVPDLRSGVDTCLYLQSDEVISAGKFTVQAGCLAVPGGPGLGVEIDSEALARLQIEALTVAL
jgi:glucarate dehydratase